VRGFDVIIRGGTVVDGTGAPARRADVGIVGDRIAEIAPGREGAAGREIDATGRLITPGFVDIHTHLDAQIHWDPIASSSCYHGVTSIVMGNCGVTFAPCRPSDHAHLAALMESVEDIPREAILTGMPWDWVTFGDYLASIDRLPKGPNVGGLVGHAALRHYVMGERGLDPAPATRADISAMADLLDEAIRRGALGFSTNRTSLHKVPDGRPIPGTFAAPDELYALADVLARHGTGVVGSAGGLAERDANDEPGHPQIRAELEWMAEVSRRSGRPVTFGMHQHDHRPDLYRRILQYTREAATHGAVVRPQTSARNVGMLHSLATRTPFDELPVWRDVHALAPAERLAAVRDALTRRALIDAAEQSAGGFDYHRLSVVGPLPSETDARYDLHPSRSIGGIAQARGVSAATAFVDLLVETDGALVCSWPFLNRDPHALEEMLGDPLVVIGLADAGAHVGEVLDASQPTWYLAYWVRERGCWSIEEGIRRLTSDPADLFGIRERGRLVEGAHADVNVIDLAALGLPAPTFVNDLPTGAGRWVQGATGYDCTIVNGQVFMEHGRHTGALPGTVLRNHAAAD
jgi:N-acyl-D-aspartate/D-glutamate deacylase